MKVAVLAPIAWRTPPRHYGPWEQVASNIAEGLIARGVDVTLFATGDSLTKGELRSICPRPYEEDRTIDPKVWECLHIAHMMEQADDFDLIHNNYDFLPLSYSRLIRTPMVTTIHGFSSPQIIPVYKRYNSTGYYVSISDSDRSPELDYTATVYNGIDPNSFSFNPDPGDYLLYFGRIHPDKGTLESVKIAKAAERKLIISGIIQDKQYFQEQIKPLINNADVVYTGHSGPAERDALLKNALALLHPINFEEPFGLSVAEAMLCGTPVIAMNRGSMPELIEPGVTGFLAESIEECVKAVARVGTIERAQCRKLALKRFSREKMVDTYLEIYRSILQER